MSSLTCVPAQGPFCLALFCWDPRWIVLFLSTILWDMKECMQSWVTVCWKRPHNVSFPLIRWPLRHPDGPTKYRLTLSVISGHSINMTDSLVKVSLYVRLALHEAIQSSVVIHGYFKEIWFSKSNHTVIFSHRSPGQYAANLNYVLYYNILW